MTHFEGGGFAIHAWMRKMRDFKTGKITTIVVVIGAHRRRPKRFAESEP